MSTDDRRHSTRSRANPGGMDVLSVLGPDVRPLRERKPPWFKVPAPGGERYRELTKLIKDENLHTVCQEAACPNVGECWERGTATFGQAASWQTVWRFSSLMSCVSSR